MADILGLDEADLREKCADSKSQYKRLAQKVDADVEKQIRTYIDDNGLTGCIYLQNNTKRYYPTPHWLQARSSALPTTTAAPTV